MRINYDYKIFLIQSYGGISRYFVSLIKNSNNFNIKINLLFYTNSYLHNSELVKKNFIYVEKIIKCSTYFLYFFNFLNRIVEFLFLIIHPPDIYHITYYRNIPLHLKKTKIVITVYDMIQELYPKDNESKLRLIKKKCIEKADLIICISNSTKQDLIKIYNLNPKNILVIHLGFENFNICDFTIKADIFKSNYILYVGQRDGYKNFKTLIDAYSSSNYLMTNYNILCCGGPIFDSNELKYFNNLNIENKITHLVPDDNLLQLCYLNSSILVYPSIYEGFGIPPLEAMAYNVPVCCSNTSSLPEVVGDAALYFDPLNYIDLQKSMIKILSSNEIKEKLIKEGQNRYKIFTWEKCVENTLLAYKSIL